MPKRTRAEIYEEAERAELPVPEIKRTPLGRLLLQAWAWGSLSAISLQALAAAALQTGAEGKDLEFLARAGSWGTQPGNIARDVARHFAAKMATRSTYSILCETVSKDTTTAAQELRLLPQHVNLPHEILSDVFESTDGADLLGLSHLNSFWDDFASSGGLAKRPVLREAYEQKMIPLMLHTDGAPYSDTGSLLQISMRSLLSDGPVADTQYLLAALPKACTTGNTWQPIYEALVSSFKCLYYGSTSYMGEEYDASRVPALKFRAVIFEPQLYMAQFNIFLFCNFNMLGFRIWLKVLAADMEALANVWKVPCHASSLRPCAWCGANWDDVPWSDCRTAAAWRRTPDRRDEWAHTFTQLPGVDFDSIFLDWMHIFDAGISQYFLGSLLEDLLAEVPGANKGARLSFLNELLQRKQGELDVQSGYRVTNLVESQFQSTAQDYPVLKRVKSRKTRQLVHTAVAMLEALPQDTEYRRRRYAAAVHLAKATQVVEESCGWQMTAMEQAALLNHYTDFARLVTVLSKEHLQQNRFRYHFTIKFHLAFHLCSQVARLSPKKTWNYGSESFVGIIAALAQGSSAGTRPSMLSHAIIRKYNVAVGLLLSEQSLADRA